jgi:long-chain fatty acid transport protein
MKQQTTTMSRVPCRLAGTLVAALAVPSVALATNGYMPSGFGLNKQMAGAGGSAMALDTMSAYTNPAAMNKLGKRIDLDLSFFMPHRSYTANDDFARIPGTPFPAGPFFDPGKNTSDNDLFLIPGFGFNMPLDSVSSLAFTMVGHGGMNTDYDTPVFEHFALEPNTRVDQQGNPVVIGFDPVTGPIFDKTDPSAPDNGNPNGIFSATDPTGVDLAQLLIGVTYSRALTPHHSIGITPMFAVQRFKAKGLQPFKQFSLDPDKVTNNDYDYSYGGGLRVGYLGTFVGDRLNFGISYQTEMYMTKLSDYKGLFADKGKFNIPAVFNTGLAFKLLPSLTVAADYKRIFYSDIKALNNENDITQQDLVSNPLGSKDGAGFGWDDVNVYQIGAQYEVNSQWTVRAGYSYGDEPWNNVNTLFNILAPATIEQHASLGVGYALNNHHEFNLSYTRAFENSIHGTSTLVGGEQGQTGKVTMDQNIVDFLYTYKF